MVLVSRVSMLGCGDHKLAVEYAFGLMGMESGEQLSGVRRAVEWLCLRKPWKHHDIAMTGAEYLKTRLSSVQFSLVAQSCPTLCNPMNCSTPGLPVHHQLPEATQIHV